MISVKNILYGLLFIVLFATACGNNNSDVDGEVDGPTITQAATSDESRFLEPRGTVPQRSNDDNDTTDPSTTVSERQPTVTTTGGTTPDSISNPSDEEPDLFVWPEVTRTDAQIEIQSAAYPLLGNRQIQFALDVFDCRSIATLSASIDSDLAAALTSTLRESRSSDPVVALDAIWLGNYWERQTVPEGHYETPENWERLSALVELISSLPKQPEIRPIEDGATGVWFGVQRDVAYLIDDECFYEDPPATLPLALKITGRDFKWRDGRWRVDFLSWCLPIVQHNRGLDNFDEIRRSIIELDQENCIE